MAGYHLRPDGQREVVSLLLALAHTLVRRSSLCDASSSTMYFLLRLRPGRNETDCPSRRGHLLAGSCDGEQDIRHRPREEFAHKGHTAVMVTRKLGAIRGMLRSGKDVVSSSGWRRVESNRSGWCAQGNGVSSVMVKLGSRVFLTAEANTMQCRICILIIPRPSLGRCHLNTALDAITLYTVLFGSYPRQACPTHGRFFSSFFPTGFPTLCAV